MKRVNKLLIGIFLSAIFLLPAQAMSIADWEKLPSDDKPKYLLKVANEYLAKVKKFDPAIEQKTRLYMFYDKNEYGYAKGVAAVVGAMEAGVKHHPDEIDKVQVETAIKVVMRGYWKDEGISVPKTIFDDAPASPAPAATNSAASGQK